MYSRKQDIDKTEALPLEERILQKPKEFNYSKTKMESWRKDAFRYHQNYKTTASLLLCPECNLRLLKASKISQDNDVLLGVIDVVLCIIAGFVFAAIDIPKNSTDVSNFIGLFADLVIGAGVAGTIGQILIYPLAKVISKPFEKKNKDSWTKWSFDDIPQIRKFLKVEQHEKSKK